MTAKRKLSNISFEHEGAHVALVHTGQGGPANGVTTLITKAVNDITLSDVEKAQVQVTLDFEDFLVKFFGMWRDDAEALAMFLGMDEDDDEADEGPMYQDYIQQKVSQWTLLKSLFSGEKKLKDLSVSELLDVKKSQSELERVISEVEKATASKKKADYAYTPDDVPSHWKLNISDARHTSGAVAALGKGFRGNKVSIPESDLAGVKAKVKSAYKKFFPDKPLPDILKSNKGVPNLETIEKSLHEEIVKKAVEAAVSEADAKTEAVLAELQKANDKIAELEKATVEQKVSVRKQRLEAVANPEKAAEILKATEALNDEAFDTIVKSLETAAKVAGKSNLFKELGGEGEATPSTTDNPTAKILKSQYAK